MDRLDPKKDQELFQKAKKELDEKDRSYFRTKRLVEIRKIPITRIDLEKEDSFIEEAENNYVQGCFRSCIFSCSSAVEGLMRHVLIWDAEDPEEMRWRIFINKWTFGCYINEAKKHYKLKRIITSAEWLNNVRNKIAVHPIYTGTSLGKYLFEKDIYKLILYNEMMT